MSALDHRFFLECDFALINPLQVSDEAWADLPALELAPKDLRDQAHLMPKLVPLRELGRERKVDLLQRSDAWSYESDLPLFSALLQCGSGSERLRNHLSAKTLLRQHDGRLAWLRYHDPRVFRHLRWMLGERFVAQLFGPIQAWSWFDPLRREWHRDLKPDGEEAAFAEARLSQAQWERLHRMELLNRMLKQLCRDDPQTIPDDALSSRLDEHLREAVETAGLVETDDQLLYAGQSFKFGAHLHRHPAMRERAAAAMSGGCSYLGGCADLDDGMLAHLAQEVRGRADPG